MHDEIVVRRIAGDAFRVVTRGHEVVVDQPADAGGGDAGPTPTELFMMSLASCVGFYAARALGRGTDDAELEVESRWTMSDTPPWRVASVELTVRPPAGLPPNRVAAIERAVRHCTVHNTLIQPPAVSISVEPARECALAISA